MKLNCSQADLSANLALISRAVPSRPTHPVLTNVLIVAKQEENKVYLTGFDLSFGIRTSFSAQVSESGALTVPAKILTDMVSRLPEGEISLNCEDELEDNPMVTISSLSGRFQLRGLGEYEYPELPKVENETPLILSVNALLQGLQGTLYAASNDESKQVLTGIHLTREGNLLEFAATDGHRLAVVQTEDNYIEDKYSDLDDDDDSDLDDNSDEEEDLDNDDSEGDDDSEEEEEEEDEDDDSDDDDEDEDEDDEDDNSDDEDEDDEDSDDSETIKNEQQNFEITIPARALRELEQILKLTKETDNIALYVDDRQVAFKFKEKHLISRKLDGNYPKYNQLMPKEFSRTMVLDRKRLITGLERAGVLLDQKNNLVKLYLDKDDNRLTVTAEARDLGTAKDSISVEIQGESLHIGFNIRYLMDGLKAFPNTEVKMQFNESNQPCIMTPLGAPHIRYLIMPVQIRD